MGSSASLLKKQSIKTLESHQTEEDNEDVENILEDKFLEDEDKGETGQIDDDDPKSSETDVLNMIKSQLKELEVMEEPWTAEGKVVFNKLLKKYFANRRRQRVVMIGDLLIEHNFLDVCSRVWSFCHSTSDDKYSYMNCKAYHVMKTVLWNYSDKCPNLAKAAHKQQRLVEQHMGVFCNPELDVNALGDNRKRFYVKATLGFLLNIVRHHNSVKDLVRQNDGVQKLLSYYHSKYLIIKAKVMILLAYCINEEENETIVTGTGVIGFIVRLLGNALHSQNHIAKTYLFSAEETTMGLDRLALNDTNKKLIVEAKVLPLLAMMLVEDGILSEYKAATHCLWTLSFHPDNKEKIIQEPTLMECVHRIHSDSSTDPDTRRSVDGVLFIVEGKVSSREEISHPGSLSDGQHVMISYQWGVQETMRQVSEYLKERGYPVWIDVDRIKGSILSAMADAVENAAVVVVAMTENYKNSNSCRTEAEYAYKLSKPVVPLLLEPGYKPDGWLGAFVGVQLYVELSHPIGSMENAVMEKLITILQSKIKVTTPATKAVKNQSSAENNSVAVSSRRTDTMPPARITEPSYTSWTAEDVQQWAAQSLGEGKHGNILPQFDGLALHQLSKLLDRCPELYYRAMKEELAVGWLDLLRLTDAIEKLT